ncbi:hypothetical protein HRW13_13060 [Streptomyces lunaelactis]|uniref:hypothetical protein n=1 Tax=Streptomyces lunaelactis TaxID=1535768 RepID=UPI001585086B|nr:hypothetical protein [Streptomyces lunaelactis]NUK41795.1 hypothetical protein [Streptomyces lunaelactis]
MTPEESEPITRDLCDEDAASLLAVFGEAVSEAREEKPPAQRKRPAKAAAEAAEDKTTAKAATRRRGKTPVMTLDEIEARKAAAAKE